MGQSADEVRRDIERTRAQMGSTIDEIGDRVSPRRMMERRTDRVRSSFRGMRESVMGTADYGIHRVSGTAADSGGSTMHAIGSGAETVGSTVSGAASSAIDTLTSAPQMARRQTAGNPLAAGLIAFGGGVLIASLLPKTGAEQQLATKVAPALEPVMEQAKSAGQQVAQELKSSAADATDELRGTATHAAEQVKQQASQAAEKVGEQATAATGDVQSTASEAASTVTDEATYAADRVRGTTRP